MRTADRGPRRPPRRGPHCAPHAGRLLPRLWDALAAFTLIELLTVILIIGILAAILIPTVSAVMQKARTAAAKADIRTLMAALTQYNMDFGAFPPDQRPANLNDALAANLDPFPASLSPNECMVWYLTRTYSSGSAAQGVLGQPQGYPGYVTGVWTYPYANGDWGVSDNPSLAANVFASVSGGPYLSPNRKQTTDIDANGYNEFVDPWGRPYMYRAYPLTAPASAQVSGPTATVNLSVPTCSWNFPPPSPGYLPPWPTNTSGYYYINLNLNNKNTIGSIQLSGFSVPALNGTFTITAAGVNATGPFVTVTLGTNLTGTYTGGQYCFPLHNPQTCDLYSLGPNGTTRAALMPTNADLTTGISIAAAKAVEWHPVDPTSFMFWTEVWGTPGDGNDTSTGNVLVNTKDQDDVNNW